MQTTTRACALVSLCFAVVSCGGKDTAAPAAAVAVTATVALSASKDSVQILDSLQYSAVLKDATGATLSSPTVAWTSSSTTIATVSTTGKVKGVRPGSITLTATSSDNGKTGTATVRITENWTAETGTRIANTTSTCTIQLTDGTFRTWGSGITFRNSTDGLTWPTLSTTAGLIAPTGESLRNPAVVKLTNGTYVMIYESAPTTGAGVLRFYRATSPDAVTWTKVAGSGTNGAVMEPAVGDTNFISVPDLILLTSGSIRMYFVAGGGHVETATSADNGATWTREGPITITGITTGRWHVDPDIIRLPDNTYRLYMAAPLTTGLSNKRIISATGTDGRAFTLESGERVAATNLTDDRVDPDVVLLSTGKYRMYFGFSTTGTYDLKSATSP